jgi:uncharacterized protein (TIGR03435 family)
VADIIAGRVLLQMTWPKKMLLAAASMLLVAAPILLGQQNAAGGMGLTGPSAPGADDASSVLAAYDVVSVKPVEANAKLTIGTQDTSDGLQATTTVCWLVRMAYGGFKQLPTEDSVTGCPDWAKTAYFNIQAKMSPEQVVALAKLDKDQQERRREQMLRALLADRFKLTIHREAKQVPDYELVVAKGGSKLKESTGPDPNAPKGADGKPLGGFLMKNGQLRAQLITMEQLANSLGGPIILGRKVTDKTGLTGKYNITLNWLPGSGTGSGSLNGIAMPPPTPDDDSAPSIFTALEEQLGLKMQRGTGTVDAVVVDHVERPVAN